MTEGHCVGAGATSAGLNGVLVSQVDKAVDKFVLGLEVVEIGERQAGVQRCAKSVRRAWRKSCGCGCGCRRLDKLVVFFGWECREFRCQRGIDSADSQVARIAEAGV